MTKSWLFLSFFQHIGKNACVGLWMPPETHSLSVLMSLWSHDSLPAVRQGGPCSYLSTWNVDSPNWDVLYIYTLGFKDLVWGNIISVIFTLFQRPKPYKHRPCSSSYKPALFLCHGDGSPGFWVTSWKTAVLESLWIQQIFCEQQRPLDTMCSVDSHQDFIFAHLFPPFTNLFHVKFLSHLLNLGCVKCAS